MSRAQSRRIVALVLASVLAMPFRAHAFIPVQDLKNFAQNLISAIEAVDQTLQMIEQVQLQTEQLDALIRSGGAPVVYTWDKVNSIRDRIRNLGQWVRDLDDHFRRYGDLNFYRSGLCYGPDLDCPGEEWRRILSDALEMHGFGAESKKASLDDLMTELEESERRMTQEAERLQALQRRAEAIKDGEHMKALQIANQLSGAQVHQLMQLRAIMVAQYRALAAEAQYRRAAEAQSLAASERYHRALAKNSASARLQVWPTR
jgi:P-type conjugative transfer protein TrbJ